MGWALDNLSADERKAIAEGLIRQGGGKVTQHDAARGELVGLCPLHRESNPSFSYSYTKDVYNCSSQCGGGDLVRLYAEVNGMGNRQAYSEFVRRYGPDQGPRRDRRARRRSGRGKGVSEVPPKLVDEAAWAELEDLPQDWVARLCAQRAWTPEAIRAAQIKLWRAPEGEARKRAKAAGLYLGRPGERRIAIPVRDYKGRLVNVRLYLPGASGNKVVSWGKGFGAARLWPLPRNPAEEETASPINTG